MKKGLITAMLLLSCGLVFSQTTEERLKKELVKVENGKMVLDTYILAKKRSENTQIHIHTEASEGTISRDNLIYYSSQISLGFLTELIDNKTQTETVNEIVGTPDILIKIFMAKSGLSMEITTDGTTNKSMLKWEEVL